MLSQSSAVYYLSIQVHVWRILLSPHSNVDQTVKRNLFKSHSWFLNRVIASFVVMMYLHIFGLRGLWGGKDYNPKNAMKYESSVSLAEVLKAPATVGCRCKMTNQGLRIEGNADQYKRPYLPVAPINCGDCSLLYCFPGNALHLGFDVAV